MGYSLTSAQIRHSASQTLALVLLCSFFIVQVLLPVHAFAFGEFTIKDELELGRKFDVLIRARMPLVQDPEVLRYVREIVQRLEKQLPPQPFPLTINVIRNASLNAFATPGGYIFVNTGFLLGMENESEVAAVLAHEITHVTQRHIAGRIETAQLVSVLSILGALAAAFLGGGAGPAAMTGALAGGQSAMLQYSRGDENEADQIGLNLLLKAGYAPQAMASAFAKLARKQWQSGRVIPTYLSTHPDLQERIHEVNTRVASLPRPKNTVATDPARFFRIQTIIHARYSDTDVAAITFDKQENGPNKCIALMGRGMLASRQNRVPDATAAFNSALACKPDDPLILREAGAFHYTKGNKEQGTRLLQQAIAADKQDIMAQFYYARSLGDAGQTAQAIEYTQSVLRVVPEDPEVHETLARYYAENKQLFKANLHIAYSALYTNNKKKVEQFRDKAKALARTQEEKNQVERLETIRKERAEYW